MKKIILFIVCALAVCACGQKKDPFQEALTDALEEHLGEPVESAVFKSFECVDTTDFKREFTMRITGFKLKYSQEKALYDKYISEKKPKNAQRFFDAARNTLDILAKLDDLYNEFDEAGKLSEPASYDFKYSAVIEGATKKLELNDAFACITPDYRVVGLNPKKSGLHKSTGSSIPGYVDIIKGLKDEPSIEEISE